MRGSVSVSLRVPESDHHTENLQFLKVLKKQKKSIVLYLLRGGPEWLHSLYNQYYSGTFGPVKAHKSNSLLNLPCLFVSVFPNRYHPSYRVKQTDSS